MAYEALEIWLPAVGWEGSYQVSSMGRVRSLISGKILRPGRASSHYLTVSLRGKTRTVHRLVIESFTGPCPEGMECCHVNGDRLDNRACNLRWDTRTENNRDLLRHGTHHYLARTHCKRGHELTDENTFTRPNRSGRYCRECHRISGRKANAKRYANREL